MTTNTNSVVRNAVTLENMNISNGIINSTNSFLELKTSGHNGSNAIILTSNSGTNETIEIHNTRGNLNHALHFVSNAGGMYVDTAKTITLDSGNAIRLDAFGDIVLDARGDIILDADGGNVSVKDGGSNILDIGHDGSGNWNIMNTTNNKKINFVTTDNNGAYHDVVDIDSTGNVNIKNGANSITFKDSLSNIGSVTSGVMDIRSNFINLEATSNVVIKSGGTESLHFGYEDIKNDGVSGGEWKIVNTDTNSNIHLVTTDSNGAQNNVLVADSYGRVGIGTTQTDCVLDIESSEGKINLKSTNSSQFTNINLESSGGDKWHISGPRGTTEGNLGFYYVDGGVFSGELLSITKDGKVGINTTTPDSVFSIHGDNGGTSDHQATLTIRNTTVTNGTENGLWRIFSYVDNNNGYLYFYNSTSPDAVDIVGYLDGPAGNQGALDFTGQHKSLMNKNINTTKVGLIVISTNNYINLDNSIIPNINESLSYCALSNIDNDKRVFGVISDKEDTNMSREYANGNFVSVFGKKNNNEQRLVINSLGEGAIWICNKNGSLDNGDYITSTTVTGYGVKQSDDILHNYTVAKITCDCHFSLTKIVKQKLKVTIDGTTSSIDYDTEGDPEYEDDLDENDDQQMVYPLETRFLQADGTLLTDEADYTTRLANGESVYIACLVGCTYHCG